jgi:hypothetical protein
MVSQRRGLQGQTKSVIYTHTHTHISTHAHIYITITVHNNLKKKIKTKHADRENMYANFIVIDLVSDVKMTLPKEI